MAQRIKVAIRFRPKSIQEQHQEIALNDRNRKVIINYGSHLKQIHYDNVFNAESNQRMIYESFCRAQIERLFKGEDSSVLIMGQKSSGKSYTLIGKDSFSFSEEGKGLIARAFDQISQIVRHSASLFMIKASCINFGKQKMHDLLSPQIKQLRLIQNANKEVEVENLEIKTVQNLEELEAYLDYASRKRPTYSKKNSEGHFVFTIYLQSKNENGYKKSQIDFVEHSDTLSILSNASLKAEQRQKKINIANLGLKNVIHAIVDGDSSVAIPYSDSHLTEYLKKSFRGDRRTNIVITVSPLKKDLGETIEYLQLGKMCRNIENYPALKPLNPETDLERHMTKIGDLEQRVARKQKEEPSQKEKQEVLAKMDTIYENEFISPNHRMVHSSSKNSTKLMKANGRGGRIGNEKMKEKQMLELMKRQILNFSNERSLSTEERPIIEGGQSPNSQEIEGMEEEKPTVRDLLKENKELKERFQKERNLYLQYIRQLQKSVNFYQQLSEKGIGKQIINIIQANSEYNGFDRTFEIPNFVIKNKQLNLKPFPSPNSHREAKEVRIQKERHLRRNFGEEYRTEEQLSGSTKGRIKIQQRSFFSPYLTRKSQKSGEKNSIQSGDRPVMEQDEYLLKYGRRRMQKREKSNRSMHKSCSQKFL